MTEHRHPLALVGGDHVLEPAHDPLLEVLQTIAEDVVLEVVEIEVVGVSGSSADISSSGTYVFDRWSDSIRSSSRSTSRPSISAVGIAVWCARRIVDDTT